MYIATSPPAAPNPARSSQSACACNPRALSPFHLVTHHSTHAHPPTYLASLETPPIMPNALPIRFVSLAPLHPVHHILNLSVDQSNQPQSSIPIPHHATY
ncbi:hypothetical protein BKA81DRAFT_348895 [Phyllosticta paracitricarpa]